MSHLPVKTQIQNSKLYNKKIPIDRYNYDISSDILNGKIQLDEVEKALGRIRKGKHGKASGIDGIPIELYSSDIKYFTPLLTTLFNTIFDSADYPDDWAQGLIYPVHKKGDKSDPQNYRKVSLIPSLSKVFESVLENRLSFKNLVCREDDPLQRGFKKDCRSSDNLFVLYNLVETQKTRKKPLYVCYIDLTKAFDYLNRDALILKGGWVSPPRGPPWATSQKAKHTQTFLPFTFHRTRFFYFLRLEVFCVCFPVVQGFSLRLLCLFSNSFQFKLFIYSLYIHIYIFFHCTCGA